MTSCSRIRRPAVRCHRRRLHANPSRSLVIERFARLPRWCALTTTHPEAEIAINMASVVRYRTEAQTISRVLRGDIARIRCTHGA
jgi:hypothetical protein